MLEIKELSFSYDEKPFITNLNLKIQKGEFLTILGKNGSGKSTILKLIFGIEKKKAGTISLNNIDLSNNIYYGRRKMGFVFQNPDEQIVSHNVESDLAFSMENYGLTQEYMENKIQEVLDMVNLKDKRHFKIENLSGGEKQRLCIASSLVLEPEILILDEPISMLDSKNRKNIMEILEKINNKGITIVIVSHNLKELEFSKRAICIEEGKIIFDGVPKHFISDIIRNKNSYSISLPVVFEFAKEIYMQLGLDISDNIFEIEKSGDKIWDLL